jgi:hypothetical protein
MNRLLKFFLLFIVFTMLISCGNSEKDNNNNNSFSDKKDNIKTDVMDKKNLLQVYMDHEMAKTLLLETWTPFKEQMESNEYVSLDDLINENPLISSFQLEGLYNHILNGVGRDSVKLREDNFIPLITDEEVEIVDIQLVEVEFEGIEYFLIITEYGEFREKDPILGGKRSSRYFVDENGDIKLFDYEGGLNHILLSVPLEY